MVEIHAFGLGKKVPFLVIVPLGEGRNSEEEIILAAKNLYSIGIYVEPTSASVLAGWRKIKQ
ncbi:MAG: hypothetical protein KAV87_15395, partial [Desulfobacteraceae bacterium]|nr:hypothetical protein [Desulfobacteraceae bacterium]